MGAAVMTERYAVIDCETTGLSPEKDEIVEVGIWTPARGAVSLMVKHETIPKIITEITGITAAMTQAEGRSITEVLTDLIGYIGELVTTEERPSLGVSRPVTMFPTIIGHNFLAFDLPFLIHACDNHGLIWPHTRIVDTGGLYVAHQLGLVRAPGEHAERYAARGLISRPLTMRWSLAECCRVMGIDISDLRAHRATGDVLATQRLYERLTA